MKVTKITVERVVNLGDFENERLAVTVVVEEGDSPAAVVMNARKFINDQQKLLPRKKG